MRVEDGEPGGGGAPDKHAGDAVAARRARERHLQVVLLALRVLPLGLVVEGQLVLACKEDVRSSVMFHFVCKGGSRREAAANVIGFRNSRRRRSLSRAVKFVTARRAEKQRFSLRTLAS